MPPIPFNHGTRSDLDADFRDALAVNYIWIPKPEHPYMRSAPGFALHGTGSGVDRGAIWNERHKEHYRISGTKLIKINQSGVSTELGDIPQSGHVALPYSFNTQAIINNGQMFLYDPTNGLRQVTDPDLGPVFDGVWINGVYWMCDTESFVLTELNDESAVDPIKYISSEFSPDPIVGVGKTPDNKAIGFNRYSTEYFRFTGGDELIAVRIEGRAIKAGPVGTHAKCEIAGTYALIGGAKEETPSVHILGTGKMDRIATREIDEILKTYTEDELALSVLEARVEDAHNFVICRLLRHTLMYDLSTKEWVILKSDVLGGRPWRGRNGVYDPRIGKWVYGDSINSNIGTLTEATPSQYGEVVEGILYTPIQFVNNVSLAEMKINHLPGRGPINEYDTAMVSMSNDGLTHQPEYSFFLGGRGNYGREFLIRRLGYVRDYYSLKVRVVNNAPTAFTGLTVEYA